MRVESSTCAKLSSTHSCLQKPDPRAIITTTALVITALGPDFSEAEKFGFLFGYPISHSYSPLMHQTVYGAMHLDWRQFLLESTNMTQSLDFMHHHKFYGRSNSYSIALSKAGAFNTVFLKQDGDKCKRVGTDTDVIGIRKAFVQSGKSAVVVRGRGAARSALYALKVFVKATTVYLTNRYKSEVNALTPWCQDHSYGDNLVYLATADQSQPIESVGAIVACVPDFAPSVPAEIQAYGILQTFLGKSEGAILGMFYHRKPWTQIAGLAERGG
ncbi:hypothetical protein E4T49_03257 [Aureobasidium sp. EXF-10728]|nr:hypothetical protein E4T49_03257 [Aureobasidium sp. EXF-10728]